MAFTRIVGAYSAPSDLTKPSTVDLDPATLVWNGILNFAATVLKSKIDGGPIYIDFFMDINLLHFIAFRSHDFIPKSKV